MDSKLKIISYSFIGMLYLILTNVEFPTKIDNYFRKNHNIVYGLLGTVYIILTLDYINKEKTPEEEYKNITNFINISYIIILIYVWYKILKIKN